MLLSGRRIREGLAVSSGPGSELELRITRLAEGDEYGPLHDHVTSVGHDVTLGCAARRAYDLSAQRFMALRTKKDGSRFLRIEPGHTVSVQTNECLHLGARTAALVHGKVRMVSRGMSPIATTVDPNWTGPLLLTFTYHGRRPFELFVGDPIATVVFFEVDQEAEQPSDAKARNNTDRWIEYGREEDEARQQRRRTKVAFAVLGVFGMAVCFMAVVAWMGSSLTSGASTAAQQFKEVLGTGRRQQIEAISWGFGILVGVTALIGGFLSFGRMFAAWCRRLFSDKARLPES